MHLFRPVICRMWEGFTPAIDMPLYNIIVTPFALYLVSDENARQNYCMSAENKFGCCPFFPVGILRTLTARIFMKLVEKKSPSMISWIPAIASDDSDIKFSSKFAYKQFYSFWKCIDEWSRSLFLHHRSFFIDIHNLGLCFFFERVFWNKRLTWFLLFTFLFVSFCLPFFSPLSSFFLLFFSHLGFSLSSHF